MRKKFYLVNVPINKDFLRHASLGTLVSSCNNTEREIKRFLVMQTIVRFSSTLWIVFFDVKVKVLLKECEEARGSVVSTTSSIGLDDLTQSYNEVSSSSEVISKRLVTFRYFLFSYST